MNKIKISVIILDFFKWRKVVENVRSLLKEVGDFTLEIVVVDNSVSKENADILSSIKDSVRLIINSANVWYSKWNNVASQYITWDYVLILNPDISFKDTDVIARLLAYLQTHKDIWIIWPKQINEDWTPSYTARRFPGLLTQIARRTFLSHIFKRNIHLYQMDDQDLSKIQDVDWLQSSFMLMSSKLWRTLWWFDETYYIFMADTEICFQTWKLWLRVVYYPLVSVCADWKRCSKWGLLDFFAKVILRIHFKDAIKYYMKHLFEKNPRFKSHK